LLTYEKFAAIILAVPHILDQLGTIVVDEVQMIADQNRGVNLEFLLTLLRMRRRRGVEPQLIALSAVIGDTNGFERWLGARLLRRTERPVPLREGILRPDCRFRHLAPDGTEQMLEPLVRREHRKGSSQDWIVPLVRHLVGEGKQVIVFRETKGDARGCARYLAQALNLPPAQAALDSLSTADPSFAHERLKECLRSGVAFHVADLDSDERQVVEEQFRAPNSTIRVIAATTTLAMGVNTPAEAVVIAGLEHPGKQPYSVAEYKNMVGRAGRLGFASEGASYLIATSPHDETTYWSRYVTASPESLQSHFVTNYDPRSLVIRTLAAVEVISKVGFLEGIGKPGAYQRE
jgi:helicase